MKFFIIAISLLFAGCASLPSPENNLRPTKVFFAEIRRITGHSTKAEHDRTGFVFYLEQDKGAAGPTLVGYRYKHGDLIQTFGGGTDSAPIVAELRAVGLQPFDFEKEAKWCDENFQPIPDADGIVKTRFATDGAEYEIVIMTPAGPFHLKEVNPSTAIDYYAPNSPNIAKLKKILDILSLYYGRHELGLEF